MKNSPVLFEQFPIFDVILTTAGFVIVIVIGSWAILSTSLMLAAIYFLASLFATLVVHSYSVCTKCPYCGKGCYLPNGKLAGFMFSPKKPGKYTSLEGLGALGSLAFAVLVPQYWLFKNPLLLVPFWLVILALLVDIVVRICPRCLNFNCLANRVPEEVRQRVKENQSV